MRLYGGTYSGYTQKVRIALAEKGLTGRVPVEIVPPAEKDGAAHRRRNPLGLVPVLELDDGTYLPESTAIIAYLEGLAPEPPLFPADPLARARALWLDRYNDQALTPPVRRLWNAVLHGDPAGADREAAEAARADIGAVYAYLDAQLGDGPYLAGAFSIADIAFMQRLQILPRFGVTVPADLTHAAAWEARLRARPSWAATMYPAHPDLPADAGARRPA